MSVKMDKNDNLYKIVNIDGVDYRIEIDENPITHKKRYKVETIEGSFLLYGGDPEELLKESLEAAKRFEELRKHEAEHRLKVENTVLDKFVFINPDGSKRLVTTEPIKLTELDNDILDNLSKTQNYISDAEYIKNVLKN